VDKLDTYQDGGLKHNNPAFIASWECEEIWKEKCGTGDRIQQIDHLISLGTGTSSISEYKIGPHSPVKSGFIQRIFDHYKGMFDGESQWEFYLRNIPIQSRSRYHRLNAYFTGPEPDLDDTSAIQSLKSLANAFITSNPKATLVRDTMIASSFYFELDTFHQLRGGSYQCSGTIFCRLPLLDYHGRKRLYHSLKQKSASFRVMDRPIACVEDIPRGMPAFRRPVTFRVKSMNEQIHITMTDITSQATPISGFPQCLSQLISAQNLLQPFGAIDHKVIERPLPCLPLKRKLEDM
jgi:hypothetical protein